jgi:hypothetical protein
MHLVLDVILSTMTVQFLWIRTVIVVKLYLSLSLNIPLGIGGGVTDAAGAVPAFAAGAEESDGLADSAVGLEHPSPTKPSITLIATKAKQRFAMFATTATGSSHLHPGSVKSTTSEPSYCPHSLLFYNSAL